MTGKRAHELLGALHWSGRRFAAVLGEHYTTVRKWLADERPIPAAVAEWLESIAAPILAHPMPTDADQPSKSPTPHRLMRMRAAMHWHNTTLAEIWGRSTRTLTMRLDGSVPVEPDLFGWLETVSAPIRARRHPAGYPRVEYLRPAEAWGRPIERAIPRPPKRAAAAAAAAERRAAEAHAKRMQAAQDRKALIIEMHQAGLSSNAIAAEAGCSGAYARKVIAEAQHAWTGLILERLHEEIPREHAAMDALLAKMRTTRIGS